MPGPCETPSHLSRIAALGLVPEACWWHGPGMASTYTAIVQQNQGWWIGWIEEVPGVNAQERTKDELLASLRESLKDALEMNREDAGASASDGHSEEVVTL